VILEVKVLWEPVDAKLAAIQALLSEPATFMKALEPAVAPTLAAERANAPFHDGGLVGNIRTESAGPMAIAVRTDLPYSWMRERGGDIRPVRAAMLHWFDYGGGEHFAMHVHQEGTHYAERAYEETRLGIPPLFRAALMGQIGAL